MKRRFGRNADTPKGNLRTDCVEAGRGPSESARQHCEQFDMSTQNQFDSVGEGWEETQPRVWHAYTDGSAEPPQIVNGGYSGNCRLGCDAFHQGTGL